MTPTVTAYIDGQHHEQRTAPEKPRTHRAEYPPERLVHRCGVVTEDGTPCPTFTLHERCYRHRRQAVTGDKDREL